MKKKTLFCILLACLLLALWGCAAAPAADPAETLTEPIPAETAAESTAEASVFPYTFTDASGFQVTLTARPERTAVLFSSLADVWQTAGGVAAITVGDSVERGFADETAVLVDDGSGRTINLELLLEAKPDFVLYSTGIKEQVECAQLLRDAGIPTAGIEEDTFRNYLDLLKICTDILGTPEAYETYGTAVAQRVDAIVEQAQNREDGPSHLFVRVGSSAKYTKAKTAENHFVGVMLDELGGKNIADAAPVLLDGLSIEEIVLQDPDMILYSTMGKSADAEAYLQSLLADPVWKTLTAVEEGKVFLLPKDLFQYKPNARWDEAYQFLFDILYGEAK